MTIEEKKFLKIILSSHVSEKSSLISKNSNTIVLKVDKKTNKPEIKQAVQKLFEVKVKSINTLIVKGKIKKQKNKIIIGRSWKKAYVTLEKNERTNLITNENE